MNQKIHNEVETTCRLHSPSFPRKKRGSSDFGWCDLWWYKRSEWDHPRPDRRNECFWFRVRKPIPAFPCSEIWRLCTRSPALCTALSSILCSFSSVSVSISWSIPFPWALWRRSSLNTARKSQQKKKWKFNFMLSYFNTRNGLTCCSAIQCRFYTSTMNCN